MGILSDRQIRKLALERGMIRPFEEGVKRPGTISYGLSSAGYDVRIGYKFRVFKSYPHDEIDPKNFNPALLEEVDLSPCDCRGYLHACPSCGGKKKDNFIRIPPHSFALGESVEEFDIPRDILVIALGKSTMARTGLIVNVTPGEPGWKGKWTIEMSNTTPLPLRVYAGEGIMQCLFVRLDERDRVTEEAVLHCLASYDNNAILEWYKTRFEQSGCEVSYADKAGKYLGQQGVTLPKVD